MAKRAVRDRPAEDEPKSITRHAGTRVLLAEDNKLSMEIAMDLPEMAGILVETAETAGRRCPWC